MENKSENKKISEISENDIIEIVFHREIKDVKIDLLKHHEAATEIYGTSETYVQNITESIERIGLKDPLLINEDYEVLDGNERMRALRALGHDTVPVRMITVDKRNEKEAIVLFNTTRNKTLLHIFKEATIMKEAYGVGRGHRTDLDLETNNCSCDVYMKIANLLNRSRTDIVNILRIGKIRPEYFSSIDRRELSLSRAAAYCLIIADFENKSRILSDDEIEKLHEIKQKSQDCYNLLLAGEYTIDEGLQILRKKVQEVPKVKEPIQQELLYNDYCKECEFRKLHSIDTGFDVKMEGSGDTTDSENEDTKQ